MERVSEKMTLPLLERSEEGNVKWRDAMLVNLIDYLFGNFFAFRAFYKKRDAIQSQDSSMRKVTRRKFCGH